MTTRDSLPVPELDLPRRPKASAPSPERAEPELELDLAPGPKAQGPAPSALRFCDVCSSSVARYAYECPCCGQSLGAELPAAPTGAIVVAPKTALEREIDPYTGRWSPLPSQRASYAPPPAPARGGFWDSIALAPMGLWTRVIGYSLFMLVVGFLVFPCRMRGIWALGLLACALVGAVGAVNRARADADARPRA